MANEGIRALVYTFYAYILHNILKSHKHCIASHDYGICTDKIRNEFENIYRSYKLSAGNTYFEKIKYFNS